MVKIIFLQQHDENYQMNTFPLTPCDMFLPGFAITVRIMYVYSYLIIIIDKINLLLSNLIKI